MSINMKLMLWVFFYFAICTIQEQFPKDPFQAYSLIDPSISREDFTEISSFISRVEAAKSKDLVTEQDIEMLLKLKFEPLFYLSCPCEWDKGGSKEDSKVTWGKINDFCTPFTDESERFTLIDQHEISFVKVLKLLYCFESVDCLSREEFFGLYYTLDFLQGGRQNIHIGKMKSLHTSFREIITNSDLQYFANQNEEFFQVLLSILTPESLSLNFETLRLRFGLDVYLTVGKVLERLARKPESSSLSKLERVDIQYFGYSIEMEIKLFEILERSSKTMTSLSIRNSKFQWEPKRKIRLTNLTEVSLGRCGTFKFAFEFLLHSNYTVLEIDNFISISTLPDQIRYFEIPKSCDKIDDYLIIIKENKNIKSLLIPEAHGLDKVERLKSAISCLKYLETLKSSSQTLNLNGLLSSSNLLHSLQIRSSQHYDWHSLGQELMHLKHLKINDYSFGNHNQFLKFLSKSKLESIFMCFFHRLEPQEKANLISILNGLNTLKKVELRFLHASKLPFFGFDVRFEALIYEGFLASSAAESKFSDLPFGPGVKYLRIRYIYPPNQPLNAKDIQVLKIKFPNLELLVLARGSNVQVSSDIGFEIRTHFQEGNVDLFNSVPSLTLR